MYYCLLFAVVPGGYGEDVRLFTQTGYPVARRRTATKRDDGGELFYDVDLPSVDGQRDRGDDDDAEDDLLDERVDRDQIHSVL